MSDSIKLAGLHPLFWFLQLGFAILWFIQGAVAVADGTAEWHRWTQFLFGGTATALISVVVGLRWIYGPPRIDVEDEELTIRGNDITRPIRLPWNEISKIDFKIGYVTLHSATCPEVRVSLNSYDVVQVTKSRLASEAERRNVERSGYW